MELTSSIQKQRKKKKISLLNYKTFDTLQVMKLFINPSFSVNKIFMIRLHIMSVNIQIL